MLSDLRHNKACIRDVLTAQSNVLNIRISHLIETFFLKSGIFRSSRSHCYSFTFVRREELRSAAPFKEIRMRRCTRHMKVLICVVTAIHTITGSGITITRQRVYSTIVQIRENQARKIDVIWKNHKAGNQRGSPPDDISLRQSIRDYDSR